MEKLKEELDTIRGKLDQCAKLEEKATPAEANQLKAIYAKLEARRDRIAVCLDILDGKAYVVKELGGKLVVVQPSENTAKLIKVAEECGARVVSK